MGQRGKAAARSAGPTAGSDDARRSALERCALFRVLEPTALTGLARGAESLRLGRKHVLYAQDARADSLWVVEQGRVRLVRDRGDEALLTIGYRAAGELVGESALVNGGLHGHAAVASESVVALRVPFAAVQDLLSHAPFALELLRAIGADLGRLERRLATFCARPVESRIAAFVGEQARVCGVPHARGVALGPKYTHQEIADYVGSTRETVTLTLGVLRRKGLVELDGRRVVVLDRKELAKLE